MKNDEVSKLVHEYGYILGAAAILSGAALSVISGGLGFFVIVGGIAILIWSGVSNGKIK